MDTGRLLHCERCHAAASAPATVAGCPAGTPQDSGHVWWLEDAPCGHQVCATCGLTGVHNQPAHLLAVLSPLLGTIEPEGRRQ